jgi:hypothetical protein
MQANSVCPFWKRASLSALHFKVSAEKIRQQAMGRKLVGRSLLFLEGSCRIRSIHVFWMDFNLDNNNKKKTLLYHAVFH